jgi:hypothetical protein
MSGTFKHSDRWGTVGLGLLVIACWMLMHPYRGITHDGTLYGLLALAHLHPGSLDHDLFVRLGVQNDYTVFTPLYAGAARHLGLERAAALLTLLTHLAFFGCAWLLARQFGSARSAWLGLGLLIALPAYYGWGRVFAYTESFLTPRQSAEAFALAGLTAALGRRHLLTAACMLGSLLLHPIIAAGAIALWATLFLALPRPRLALTLVITGTALLVILSAFVAKGPFAHFDVHWLTILKDRLKYLFPTQWPADDWGPTVVPLCALFIGALAAKSQPLRQLCLAAVLTVSFGVLIAVVESDALHVIIAGQVQLWRWLWLSGVLAALLVPIIATDCWRAGGLHRAAIVLLAAAWLDTSGMFAVLAALGACSFVIAAPGIDNPRLEQLMLLSSCVLLAFSLSVVVVAIHHSLAQEAGVHAGSLYSRCMQTARLLSDHGALPALALVVACFVSDTGLQWAQLVAALGAAACMAVAPQALDRWTQIAYSPQRLAAFAAWRTAIPPGTPVLWPEDPPMDDWFVLERPAYWSLYQMAGMVFSRDDAMIGTWLESEANPVLPAIRRSADRPLNEGRSARTLTDICRLPGMVFFASWNNLGPTPYPPVAPGGRGTRDVMYLYRCGPLAASHAEHTVTIPRRFSGLDNDDE